MSSDLIIYHACLLDVFFFFKKAVSFITPSDIK